MEYNTFPSFMVGKRKVKMDLDDPKRDDELKERDDGFEVVLAKTSSAKNLSRRIPFVEARKFPLLNDFIVKLDKNRWNVDVWLALVSTVSLTDHSKIPIYVARDIFDNATIQFPSLSNVWIAWIKYEQGILNRARDYALENRNNRGRQAVPSRKKRTLADLEENDLTMNGKLSNSKDKILTDDDDDDDEFTKRSSDSLLSDDDMDDPNETFVKRLDEKDAYDQKVLQDEQAQAKENEKKGEEGNTNSNVTVSEKPLPPKPTDYLVLKIFNRALRCCLSIDVAQLYVSFIISRFPPREDDGTIINANRATIIHAYEFVLQFIGTDVKSGSVWTHYIKFVKSAFPDSEQQQRMELLRKIYHRAIWTPLNNIEQLWQDYDAFENALNKITAKKFVADKSNGYMIARATLRELESYLELINRLNLLWVARIPTWSEKEMIVLREWKKYIAYEMTNPLGLEDEELVHTRVAYAFRSALSMLRFYPEVWHMYARYCISIGRPKQAIQILQSATKVLPNSLLISFTLAEVYEVQKKPTADIYNIFDTLLRNLAGEKKEINLKYDYWLYRMLKMYEEAFSEKNVVKKEDADESEIKDIPKSFKEDSLELPLYADSELNSLMLQLDQALKSWLSKYGPDADDEEWDGERRERERERKKKFQQQIGGVIESKRKNELESLRNCIGLVWVVYMRTARRVKDISSARQIFKLARQVDDKYGNECPFQVWVCAALMEYHINKDAKIAARIFEFSLKTFDLQEDPQAEDLVLQYLDFLVSLNNDTNTRALFERTLSILPPKNSRRVWDRFLNYELQFGDLQSFLNVEKRMKTLYKEEMDEKKAKLQSRIGANNIGTDNNEVDKSINDFYSDSLELEHLKEVAGRWDCMQESVIAERELGISKQDLFVSQFSEEHDKILKKKSKRNNGKNSSKLPQFGLYDIGVNSAIISNNQNLPTSVVEENFTGLNIYSKLVEISSNGLTVHSLANSNGELNFGKNLSSTGINQNPVMIAGAGIPSSILEDPSSYNPKKLQSLTSVTPNKFPRPDFRRWNSYKPEQAFISSLDNNNNGLGADNILQYMAQQNNSFARFIELVGPAYNYQGPLVDPQTVISLLQGIQLKK